MPDADHLDVATAQGLLTTMAIAAPADDGLNFYLEIEARDPLDAGVRCLTRGETIESRHRHDFVTCLCGAIYVDDGQNCVRMGGAALESGAWVALFEPGDADDVPEPEVVHRRLER
jgi:hypothetical protein